MQSNITENALETSKTPKIFDVALDNLLDWGKATLIFFAILTGITGITLVHVRFPVRHLDVISEHKGNFDEAFILAVIHAESTFRPNAMSHRYAMGLMQVTEPTGEWLAELMGISDYDVSRLFEPELNIALGSYFLNWLWSRYDGDITLILSAYNAGPTRVNNWLQDERFSKDGQTLYYIPFPETREYVRRVNRNWQIYTWLLRLPWINLV